MVCNLVFNWNNVVVLHDKTFTYLHAFTKIIDNTPRLVEFTIAELAKGTDNQLKIDKSNPLCKEPIRTKVALVFCCCLFLLDTKRVIR